MDEVLHANIFFVIASVATVVFCILTSIILYQVLKIVRSIRLILERIEAGSEKIAQDLESARAYIHGGGMVSRVISFVMGAAGARRRNRRQED